MKYCANCGYENLDEMFSCRHCGFEFEDFDWDNVERENISRDSEYLSVRVEEQEIIERKMSGSVVKDWAFLLFSSVICLGMMHYGLYHSWFWYWLFLFIYGIIVAWEIPLFLRLFRVNLITRVHGIDFYNYKYRGVQYFLAGLTVLVGLYPFTLYNFTPIIYFVLPGAIVPLLIGVCYFLRPKTFNEYTDYAFLNSYLLMWLTLQNILFGYLYLNAIKLFPTWILVCLGVVYLIVMFTLLFPDVVNKYNKYDIRGPNSLYILNILGSILILFFSLLIIAKLLGIMH